MDFTSTLIVVATWGVIFLIHEINGCNGQDLNGPEFPMQYVLMGGTHTLSCSRGSGVTQDVTWIETAPSGNAVTISLGSNIVATTEPKYNNFAIDTNNDNGVDFNLEISNAAVEDEGVYFCSLFGTSISSETATLTVEVRASSMEMKQDDIAVTEVTLTESVSSNITCTALGARPVVEIWWYHQQVSGSETRIMTGVTQTETSNVDGTFDTISTLQYTASRVYNGGSIRCVTTGQEVAGSRSDTASMNVQYPPDVSVQYGGDKAICLSDANPDVPLKGYADMEGYIFIINNTDEYAPTECSDGQCTLYLEIKFNTDVRCNATNSIGTGFATTVAIPGAVITTTSEPTTQGRGTTIGGEVICNDTIYVAFLVILSLLLVALLAFNIMVVIRYNRLLKSGKPTDTQLESRTPKPTNQGAVATGRDNYQELNVDTRVKEHAYQQPNSSALPQHVENEQGPMYEDLNNPSNDNQPTYEVAGDEVKAGGNQQSPMYVNARPTRPRHGKHNK